MLQQDPLYDRLKATLKLSGMQPFHGSSRKSKTHQVNHKKAKVDIKKEHAVSAATHDELEHYKQILSRYMEDQEYTFLASAKMKVEILNDLSCTITNRLNDLFAIEQILYNDNPNREDFPDEFCDAVAAAKDLNAEARGGMLHFHAYLKNNELNEGGPHGNLREPPTLKEKKKVVDKLAKGPKALIRRITGL